VNLVNGVILHMILLEVALKFSCFS